jgi:hypothetical protein
MTAKFFSSIHSICLTLSLTLLSAGCVPVINSYKLQRTQKELDTNEPAEAQATLDSCFDSEKANNLVGVLWAVSLGALYTPICMIDKNHDPTVRGLEDQISNEQQVLDGKSQVAAQLKSAASAFESENYTVARDHYVNASKSVYLSDAEKREAFDGICIAEQKAGEAPYPFETQYQDCLEASKRPDSATGPLLSVLATQLKADYERSIDAAIAAKEDAKAETLLDKYKMLPDSDRSRIPEWERQAQRIKEARSHLEEERETARANAAVARLEGRYPEVRQLSQGQFENFIVRNYTILSAPFFTDARIEKNGLQLTAPNADIHTLMDSQATLDEINDYFVAWCHCNGTTHVVGDYYGHRIGLATVNLNVEDQHSFITFGR